MAVEVEATGQIDEFIRVLRRRIWWIIVPLAVIGSLGIFYAVIVPKKYVSRCEMMVRKLGEQAGEFGQTAAVEGQLAEFNIKSPRRVDSVLNLLKWPEYMPLNGAEKAEYRNAKIFSNLTVSTPPMPRNSGQQKVIITFRNTDPQRATNFLGTLKDSWTEEVLNRNLNEQKLELNETDDRLKDVNQELMELRERITNIRTENAIPPSTMTAQGQIESQPAAYAERDRVQSRIQTLIEEVRVAEDQLKLKTAERDRLPAEEALEYEADDPLTLELNALDEAIGRAELDIASKGWSPGHSERRKAEALIRGLKLKRERVRVERDDQRGGRQSVRPNSRRVKLTDEIQTLASEVELKARRQTELEVRLAELTQETERLNIAFRELAQLTDDLSVAQVTKQALSSRVETLRVQVRTMASEQGNPFELLDGPTEPIKPTSPNPWAIGLGAIVFGLGLGLALAILLEYSKNCFRSPRELSRVMPYPVLGTINAIKTRRERARAFVTRAILGGGSLAFVAGVAFVTWAWASEQQVLNGEVVRAIEAFRGLLM